MSIAEEQSNVISYASNSNVMTECFSILNSNFVRLFRSSLIYTNNVAFQRIFIEMGEIYVLEPILAYILANKGYKKVWNGFLQDMLL